MNQIGQLNFNKAFIGMNGIDENFYTTPDMEEGAVKRAILENAKQTYILADFKNRSDLFRESRPYQTQKHYY